MSCNWKSENRAGPIVGLTSKATDLDIVAYVTLFDDRSFPKLCSWCLQSGQARHPRSHSLKPVVAPRVARNWNLKESLARSHSFGRYPRKLLRRKTQELATAHCKKTSRKASTAEGPTYYCARAFAIEQSLCKVPQRATPFLPLKGYSTEARLDLKTTPA